MSMSADCPICAAPAAPRHRPFCSPRCRDRDLLNWLGDRYVLPAAPANPEDGAAEFDAVPPLRPADAPRPRIRRGS
jgi:endogenous inhibitor of DNA gyrase (YacG/DUF329 family)